MLQKRGWSAKDQPNIQFTSFRPKLKRRGQISRHSQTDIRLINDEHNSKVLDMMSTYCNKSEFGKAAMVTNPTIELIQKQRELNVAIMKRQQVQNMYNKVEDENQDLRLLT